MSADVAQLAMNVARNLRWPVFPCRLDTKAPTRPKARRDLWSSAVITAVHAVHPEVLA